MNLIILAVIVVLALHGYRKYRAMNNRIVNLTKRVNLLAIESSNTSWIASRNKEDVLLIQEALNIKDVA